MSTITNGSEMPKKEYNHGFVFGQRVVYGIKAYTVIIETPNYVKVVDDEGERHEIWSKHLIK